MGSSLPMGEEREARAIVSGHNLAGLKSFLKRFNPDTRASRNYNGQTMLALAVSVEWLDGIAILLGSGANPNPIDLLKENELDGYIAMQRFLVDDWYDSDKSKAVKLLVEAGMRPTYPEGDDTVHVLHHAVSGPDTYAAAIEAVQMWLEAGVTFESAVGCKLDGYPLWARMIYPWNYEANPQGMQNLCDLCVENGLVVESYEGNTEIDTVASYDLENDALEVDKRDALIRSLVRIRYKYRIPIMKDWTLVLPQID